MWAGPREMMGLTGVDRVRQTYERLPTGIYEPRSRETLPRTENVYLGEMQSTWNFE